LSSPFWLFGGLRLLLGERLREGGEWGLATGSGDRDLDLEGDRCSFESERTRLGEPEGDRLFIEGEGDLELRFLDLDLGDFEGEGDFLLGEAEGERSRDLDRDLVCRRLGGERL